MDNRDYARVLSEIAALMQIKGSNRFRIRAFENAARTVETQAQSIEDLLDSNEITDLKGIGDSIAQDLRQIRERGTCDLHESLLDDLDPGLLVILRIQGLGPKKVKAIYDELQIVEIETLRKAAEAQKIRELPGFGARTEEKILSEIERLERAGGRIPLPRARRIAESIEDQLRQLDGVQDISIAGSLRRGRETIGDIDLVIATDDPAPIHQKFGSLTEVDDVLVTGETKTSVRLRSGVQVDLRTVKPSLFGSALHYFTGSKEHHITLRTRAKRQGLKISEYGVFSLENEDEPIASRTEEEVYAALGLDYIPPELREDRDEIERAENHSLPSLVDLDDIRGDIHMHTTETDGNASIQEMAQAAAERGYQFIAITDHSQDVRVANGMTPERFAAHIEAINQVDQQMPDFRVLSGIEVDILKDGSLDMDHDLLARCDWVVGSIHSHFTLSPEAMTERLCTAIDTGLLSCLGHPTGRILGGRDGYEYDFDVVIEKAIEHDVAFEINGSSGRLDLNADRARYAQQKGALIVLGSDAHSQRGLDDLRFAVQQARRAELGPESILNSLSAEELLSRVGKTRS